MTREEKSGRGKNRRERREQWRCGETRGKKRRPEKSRGDERKGVKIVAWHRGKSPERQCS